MINAWKVQWTDEGTKKIKRFEGEKPTEAVNFAKEMRGRGISVDVISARRAFAPTKQQVGVGTLWCPYCVKWREFRIFAIRKDGVLGPELDRCPVCTISIRDYYVKRFNPDMVARMEFREEVKKVAAKVTPRTRRRTR